VSKRKQIIFSHIVSFRIYFGIWLSSYYRFWNKFRMTKSIVFVQALTILKRALKWILKWIQHKFQHRLLK